MFKNIIVSTLLLITINLNAQQNSAAIPLFQYVQQLKEKNESLKSYDSVNVMVNDLLIEDQKAYIIDPKNIARLEILVIDPKKNTNKVIPSIIIGTKKK